MAELLRNLGIPIISVLFLIVALAVLKELFMFVKSLRQKGAELVLEKELKELDSSIEEFYMPLRERFQLTKLLRETSNPWKKEGRYNNAALNIESEDSESLRHIMVRRIFIPINEEIKNIVLNKLHWKHPDDDTNYEYIVQHFMLWQALESAKTEGDIADYEASHVLTFPSEEVKKQQEMCKWLLNERERIHKHLREFKSTKNKRRL